MVYVADTGVGISETNKAKVFKRFEKLNSFVQGTGLGLSICYAIVDSQGGQIDFESSDGNGCRFWAWLPCETKCDGLFKKEQIIADSKSSVINILGKRILVAEDNDSNFVLIRSMLKSHVIERAINGIEVVEMYLNGNYDIILMDLKMPVRDGIEATKIIRESNKSIPIIAITAYAFDSDRDMALHAGCNAVVTKPISFTTLKNVIDDYI